METYWYCGVQIKGSGRPWSYISDAGELPLDTCVMVPFGKQDTPRVGIVTSCTACTAQDAPYPVEQTKHIIRSAAKEEYENEPPVPPFDAVGDAEDEDDLAEVAYYIKMDDWDDVFDWACEHHDCPDGELLRKAAECYALCAQRGIPEAALNLGTLYYTGRGVAQDYQKAFELYKTAADAGVRRAICNCGYCFCYGRHQETDYARAREYFSLGALLYDDANCLYKLGDLYANGFGVEKNERYAFLLYERALYRCGENDEDAHCLADAQFRVGKCLLDGAGTPADTERAHELLSLALVHFYKRRRTDPFVAERIRATKELLARAQARLDREPPGGGAV